MDGGAGAADHAGVRGESGQSAGEYAGVLVVIAAIFAAIATTGVGTAVAGTVDDVLCRITGGSCEATEDGPRLQGAADGPALGHGLIEVLPFPGSASSTQKKPVAEVEASVTGSIDRSQTKLDGKGCPQQTASLSTTLKLEGAAAKKGVGISAYLGQQTKYSVTSTPDQLDAIADGERRAPNPLDPSSFAPGESVQMSEEYYRGVGRTAEYKKLKLSLGYEDGRRVSSGAKAVDDHTMRVYVGDEDFVRRAMTVGLGGKQAKVEVGFNQEMSEGKLRAIDIDVGTPEGWAAYQRFATTGEIPPGATTSTTRKLSKSATVGATFGDFQIGGLLRDAEGTYVETKRPDGKVDYNLNIRSQDVGLEVGVSGDQHVYALNLEGVRDDVFRNFQELNRRDTSPPADGNVRMDFSADDLMAMRRQALEQTAMEMEQRGVQPRPTPEEVADNLARNHGVIKVNGVEYTPEGAAAVLANARTPEEALEGLYRLANGDPNEFLTGPVTDFVLRTNAAHGNANPARDGRLPGAVHGPKCA